MGKTPPHPSILTMQNDAKTCCNPDKHIVQRAAIRVTEPAFVRCAVWRGEPDRALFSGKCLACVSGASAENRRSRAVKEARHETMENRSGCGRYPAAGRLRPLCDRLVFRRRRRRDAEPAGCDQGSRSDGFAVRLALSAESAA